MTTPTEDRAPMTAPESSVEKRLITSMQQAVEIARGEREPSRVTSVALPPVERGGRGGETTDDYRMGEEELAALMIGREEVRRAETAAEGKPDGSPEFNAVVAALTAFWDLCDSDTSMRLLDVISALRAYPDAGSGTREPVPAWEVRLAFLAETIEEGRTIVSPRDGEAIRSALTELTALRAHHEADATRWGEVEAIARIREEMATPGMHVDVRFDGGYDIALTWWNDEDCLAEVDGARSLAEAVGEAFAQMREDAALPPSSDAPATPSSETSDA